MPDLIVVFVMTANYMINNDLTVARWTLNVVLTYTSLTAMDIER